MFRKYGSGHRADLVRAAPGVSAVESVVYQANDW
jgi:hypothetical protein